MKGSGPTVKLAFDGERVVSILKADFAEGDRLTSLLAIAYPQQHGVAVKVLWLVSRDVCQIDAGFG